LVVIDLSRVRRKAVSAKRQNDKDFMKFCEAVGILAGLQGRGRDAAAFARGLDYDEALLAARAFLAGAFP